MSQSLLSDRGVIAVTGEEAGSFLNRMVTNNVLDMRPAEARFAALLSPQGKLLFDFFVVRDEAGFLLDCVKTQTADLAKKLHLFKLRAKVTVMERRDDLGVAAVWDRVAMEAPGLIYRDPRANCLGFRIIGPQGELQRRFKDDAAAYEAHRITLGIPKGGADFDYGDTFVHDANMDLLHGVDFHKGCYVGQEVVSRVQHRNSARKRVVRLQVLGEPPALGAAVVAGETALGTISSVSGETALATLRIDRLAEATAAGLPAQVVGKPVAALVLPGVSEIEAPADAQPLF